MKERYILPFRFLSDTETQKIEKNVFSTLNPCLMMKNIIRANLSSPIFYISVPIEKYK